MNLFICLFFGAILSAISVAGQVEPSVSLRDDEEVYADILGSVRAFWRFPRDLDKQSYKGIYLLFHDCHQDPEFFFSLPENRKIVEFLLGNGYAVLALGTKLRTPNSRRCWSSGWPVSRNWDLRPIQQAIQAFKQRYRLQPLKVYALGVGSGGTFATLLKSIIQSLAGVVVVNSAGRESTIDAPPMPPMAFVYSSRYADLSQEIADAIYFLDRRDTHTTVLEYGPRPYTPYHLTENIDGFPKAHSKEIFEALDDFGFLDCSTGDCMLLVNPIPISQFNHAIPPRLSEEANQTWVDMGPDIEQELAVCWGAKVATSEHMESWLEWIENLPGNQKTRTDG